MAIGAGRSIEIDGPVELTSDVDAALVAILAPDVTLGEVIAEELPVHANLLRHKFDFRVLPRLRSLLRRRKIDAVVTVGFAELTRSFNTPGTSPQAASSTFTSRSAA